MLREEGGREHKVNMLEKPILDWTVIFKNGKKKGVCYLKLKTHD